VPSSGPYQPAGSNEESRHTPDPPPAGPVPTPPLVVAHRGANQEAAEHTLAAYRHALDLGADALECDVRMTRDGHLVCMHDRTTERTSGTKRVVSSQRLSDLQVLDFHAYKRPAPEWDLITDALWEPPTGLEGRQVLTFDRLLDLVRDAGRPVQLLVETKHPTRYSGLVEVRLAQTLTRRGLHRPDRDGVSPVTVMSFNQPALRRMRRLAPQVPLVLLMDKMTALRKDGSLPTGVGIAGPGIHLLRDDPQYVARAHGHGNRVYVWTADAPADVRLLAHLGVDAVISNRPDAVLQVVGRSVEARPETHSPDQA